MMRYNKRVAKKTWKCTDCFGKIKKGEYYLYENHIWQSSTRVRKFCSKCLNLFILMYLDVEDQIIVEYKLRRKE